MLSTAYKNFIQQPWGSEILHFHDTEAP